MHYSFHHIMTLCLLHSNAKVKVISALPEVRGTFALDAAHQTEKLQFQQFYYREDNVTFRIIQAIAPMT